MKERSTLLELSTWNLILAAASVALLGASSWSFTRSRRTARWPRVTALVVRECSVEGVVALPLEGEPVAEAVVAVQASYTVAGRSYTTKLALDASPGSHVELAYNPEHPEDALASGAAGSTTSAWFLGGLGLLAALVAVLRAHAA